jgi:hypothetical protein
LSGACNATITKRRGSKQGEIGDMETKVRRTLVKSAPEIWELASSVSRMEAWTADLLGAERPVPVEVFASEPERVLAWMSVASVELTAAIAVEFSEGSFGTVVQVIAEHSQPESTHAEAALQRLLIELAVPAWSPIVRNHRAPSAGVRAVLGARPAARPR